MTPPQKNVSPNGRFGTGSRQPIRRVVAQEVFTADALGEVHLALCEHEPRPGEDRLRVYLHLHAHNETGRKPAALNHVQLRGLIDRLSSILDSIVTSPATTPVLEVVRTSASRRTRRRPVESRDGVEAAEPSGDAR